MAQGKKPAKKTTVKRKESVKKTPAKRKVSAKKAAPRRKATAKKAAPKKRKVIKRKPTTAKKASAPAKKKQTKSTSGKAEKALLASINAIIKDHGGKAGTSFTKQISTLLDLVANQSSNKPLIKAFNEVADKDIEFKREHGLATRSPSAKNACEKHVKSLLTLLSAHADNAKKLDEDLVTQIKDMLTANVESLEHVINNNAGLGFELYASGILPNHFYSENFKPAIKSISQYIDRKLPITTQLLCLNPNHPLGRAFCVAGIAGLSDTHKSADELNEIKNKTNSTGILVADIVTNESEHPKLSKKDLTYLKQEINNIEQKWKQNALEHAIPPKHEKGMNEDAYKLVREENMKILEAVWEATHEELFNLEKQLNGSKKTTKIPKLKITKTELAHRQKWFDDSDENDFLKMRKSPNGAGRKTDYSQHQPHGFESRKQQNAQRTVFKHKKRGDI